MPKYAQYAGIHTLASIFTIQSKKTQQNETYFPKADIDNICGYNRNI